MKPIYRDIARMPVEEWQEKYMDELYVMFYYRTLKRLQSLSEAEYKKELWQFFKTIDYMVELETPEGLSGGYRKPTKEDLNRDAEEFADYYIDVMDDEFTSFVVDVYMRD